MEFVKSAKLIRQRPDDLSALECLQTNLREVEDSLVYKEIIKKSIIKILEESNIPLSSNEILIHIGFKHEQINDALKEKFNVYYLKPLFESNAIIIYPNFKRKNFQYYQLSNKEYLDYDISEFEKKVEVLIDRATEKRLATTVENLETHFPIVHRIIVGNELTINEILKIYLDGKYGKLTKVKMSYILAALERDTKASSKFVYLNRRTKKKFYTGIDNLA